MNNDTTAGLAQRIDEVESWCSLQELTPFHRDSPEEARRRELLKEASRLLATAKYPSENWTRALELLREADSNSLAPLEHQLRSSELKPIDLIDGDASQESWKEMAEGVINRRSSVINTRALRDHIGPGLHRGRLLLYVPSENISDGASQHSSNGFFDVNDCPPWDLWLQYSDRTLISWVPEILLPLAQAGIDVNAVECIRWLDANGSTDHQQAGSQPDR